MQRTRFIALLIAAILIGTVSAAAQKKDVPKGVAIEKEKSGRVAHLKPLQLVEVFPDEQTRRSIPLHQISLEVLYPFSGDAPSGAAGDVKLRFQVSSSKYIFLHSQKIMLALDNDKGNGRAIVVGDSNYDSKPPEFNTVYVEILQVTAPAEILSRIAKAETAEIYVGPVTYKLSKDQQQKLSAYFGYINP